MTYLPIAITVAAALITTNVAAAKYQFVAMDNTLETQLCVYAGANKKSAFKSTLRKLHYGTKYRVVNNLHCNDVSLAKFAYQYGAEDTFNYINRYTYPSKKVNPKVIIRDIAKLDKPIVIQVSTGN